MDDCSVNRGHGEIFCKNMWKTWKDFLYFWQLLKRGDSQVGPKNHLFFLQSTNICIFSLTSALPTGGGGGVIKL